MSGNYREAWAVSAWGDFPWPATDESAPYFLPATVLVAPTPERVAWSDAEEHHVTPGRSWRRLDRNRGGGDITIVGGSYQGGRWNGPLTAAQAQALAAAGYGGRLYWSAPDGSGLPAGLDS